MRNERHTVYVHTYIMYMYVQTYIMYMYVQTYIILYRGIKKKKQFPLLDYNWTQGSMFSVFGSSSYQIM